MFNPFKTIIITLSFVQIQSCALLAGDPIHKMPIMSKPGEALVEIRDERGIEIYKGETPLLVNLAKSDGSYFGGKRYLITISKPGYKTMIFPVIAVPNNYYSIGNVATAYIGWLFVDPFFADMYDLSPDLINVELRK